MVRPLLFYMGIFLLLHTCIVFAAIPPSGELYVLYDGVHVPNVDGLFLGCTQQDHNSDLEINPVLSIREFDKSRNCTWKPSPYEGQIECYQGTCHADLRYVDGIGTKMVISAENRLFITNEIDIVVGLSESFNFYRVALFSNGSAVISRTDAEDVRSYDLEDERETNQQEVPEPDKVPYGLLMVIVGILFWIAYKMKKH